MSSGPRIAAVRDRAALAAARDHPQRPGLDGRQLCARRAAARRHAARAQARHDHLSLGGGVARAVRPRALASTDTSGDPFGLVFEVESYLEHHAHKFTGQFDANCYLYLSRASDLFDVAEHGSSVEAALAQAPREARARHRREDRLPVPDPSAARARRRARGAGPRGRVRRAELAPRATTRSSSTWTTTGRCSRVLRVLAQPAGFALDSRADGAC